MRERMTLSNMSAELGAQTGLIAPDGVTAACCARPASPTPWDDYAHWRTDAGAPVDLRSFDATTLAPMVALPHSPPMSAIGQIAAHRSSCYIGACGCQA